MTLGNMVGRGKKRVAWEKLEKEKDEQKKEERKVTRNIWDGVVRKLVMCKVFTRQTLRTVGLLSVTEPNVFTSHASPWFGGASESNWARPTKLNLTN
jgi:hypothetical protein